MIYIRQISYKSGENNMFFRHGQILNDKFKITKIGESFIASNHIIDIFVSGLHDNVSAKWKRIINGVEIIEYNVDFLCDQ